MPSLEKLKDKHFEEALKNFTNAICAKQRENCVNSYSTIEHDLINHDPHEAILYAEQPKIEELMNTEQVKSSILEQAAQKQKSQESKNETQQHL